MRITCPACASVYEVPPGRMVAGGALRCARCGERWRVPAEAAQPATPPIRDDPAAPEADGGDAALPAVVRPDAALPDAALPDVAVPDAAAPPPPAAPVADSAPALPLEARVRLAASGPVGAQDGAGVQGARVRAAAWAGSLVVLASLLAALLAGHAAIGRAWPPMQRLYAMLGLQ